MGDLKSVGQWQNFLADAAMAVLAGQPNATESAAFRQAQNAKRGAQGTLAQEHRRKAERKAKKKQRKAKLGKALGTVAGIGTMFIPGLGPVAAGALSGAVSSGVEGAVTGEFDPAQVALSAATGAAGGKMMKGFDKVGDTTQKVGTSAVANAPAAGDPAMGSIAQPSTPPTPASTPAAPPAPMTTKQQMSQTGMTQRNPDEENGFVTNPLML